MNNAEQPHSGNESAPFPPTISSAEVMALSLDGYTGPIETIDTMEDAERAVRRFRKDRVLGFDTETRACFRKGESYRPALVQLAGERQVAVFRIQLMGGLGPLTALFEDRRISKVGVAIAHDIRQLIRVQPFEPRQFVELQTLTDRLGIQTNGLRGLAALILGFRVSKGAQRTNWERPHLSEGQLRYAATDAWVCRRLFEVVEIHATTQDIRHSILRPPPPTDPKPKGRSTRRETE